MGFDGRSTMIASSTPSAVSAPPAASRRGAAGLALKSVVGIALLSALLLIGIVVIMNTYGRRLVIAESARKIEQTGNKSVEVLSTRLREIGALTRTLAETIAALPVDEALVRATLPRLIDFQSDLAVAGGGYWPEPGAFTPGVDRRSFFWGRDAAEQLAYFDDYNAPLGPGYHNEEWYVPVKFLPPGRVFWSRSYQDPYSYQPMVTCTSNLFADGKLSGTATIDLKLEGLAGLVEDWQRDVGGYGFLVDRNNKFLTFPKPEMVRRTSVDEAGKRTEEFVTVADLAGRDALFAPLAEQLAAMDRAIVERARALPGFDATVAGKIDAESYQIDAAEATMIAAVMADPFAATRREQATNLFTRVDLDSDLLNKEPSTAFLFNVPDSYWKLVLVVPVSTSGLVARQISNRLLLSSAATILPTLLLAYLVFSRRLIRPVTQLSAAARQVRDGDLEIQVPVASRDELGTLSESFNEMVRQLRTNTEDLRVSNLHLAQNLAMTDTIMGTVHEGLFLLSPNLTIESRYSAALARIFARQNLAGARFLDLIRRLTPEKTFELTDRFLKLVFNAQKNDSVIAKINPLKEVEASFPGADGQLERKYLSFTFDRIWQDGEVYQAMVTVEDVTEQVLLAQRLQASEQRRERQTDLLLSILHVEPRMLRDFVDGAYRELQRISDLLKKGQKEPPAEVGERQRQFRDLVDQIHKGIHGIKGTASMLKIDFFASAAHRFEDKLAPLRSKRNLDGEDFLPVVLELSEMIDSLVEIRDVIGRFGELNQWAASAPSARSDQELLTDTLDSFVRDLGARHGKRATLRFQASGDFELPFTVKAPIQNVLAQLVRNSMVHGLETPAERAAAGKPEFGSIVVAARRNDGRLELLFRDDGRGLDYTKLVERVREMAKSEPALLERLIDRETNRWRLPELNEIIFQPGFSTAENEGEDAGRGMGLAAVRDLLAGLGGEITLRQKPGQFCEFHILVPLPDAA
jgi:HAMP domain-containing protein/HPt (histidine-containing phosphotransfer) domain-containing protein/two-component sensor histidine kinase